MNRRHALVGIGLFALWLAVVTVGTSAAPPPVPSADPPGARLALANPASRNCTEQGGELEMKTLPDGGRYGVCVFADNRQCEEWALFRGECPAGGIKITGYDSDMQIYCAITGGEVNMQAGTCQRPDGSVCSLEDDAAGACANRQPAH